MGKSRKIRGNAKYCEEGRCGYCGSEKLEWEDRLDEGKSVGFEFMCMECGESGIEWYELKYVETFMK